jgi:hypothetical protein
MKWSILILTITKRCQSLIDLIDDLYSDIKKYDDIEILYLGDNMKRSTGEKRQLLLNMAQGEYISFIDDDDKIAFYYVDKIYKELGTSDVINFKVEYNNKDIHRDVVYDIYNKKECLLDNVYYRWPNHLMVVRRELALKAGFDSEYIYEDKHYAERLRPLIKTQTNIDITLYYYMYDDATSETVKHLPKK